MGCTDWLCSWHSQEQDSCYSCSLSSAHCFLCRTSVQRPTGHCQPWSFAPNSLSTSINPAQSLSKSGSMPLGLVGSPGPCGCRVQQGFCWMMLDATLVFMPNHWHSHLRMVAHWSKLKSQSYQQLDFVHIHFMGQFTVCGNDSEWFFFFMVVVRCSLTEHQRISEAFLLTKYVQHQCS